MLKISGKGTPLSFEKLLSHKSLSPDRHIYKILSYSLILKLCPEFRFPCEIMSSSNSTCYYKDGKVAKNDHFCGLPNYNTCCGFRWKCLSSGLCGHSAESQEYAEGSCTNPNFEKCLSANTWCFICALKDPNGPGCCDTNLTTSIEPYPFTTGSPLRSRVNIFTFTTSISSVTELIPTLSSSSYRDTSLELTSETSSSTSTQTSATPSGTLTSSPSTPSTSLSHNSKPNMNVGIIVAVVAVPLAVLAFFVFQNRKFKQHLLQLREGPSRQEGTRTAVQRDDKQRDDGTLPGELDITHYELTQQSAPQHELSGNEIYELYHRGISEHDLNRDNAQE